MTIGAAQQFFLGASKATGGGGAGYQIERSLRFNSSDSAYLSRLPSNTSTTTTWTWSAWVKRSTLGSKAIFGAYYSNLSRYFLVRFSSSDQIEIFGGDYSTSITTTNVSLITTSVYRDTSAWMHIVFTYDTTNAVSSDRARLYINGDRVTVFSTAVYPGPSSSTFINYNTTTHYVGAWQTGIDLFDGYLANIHFIDGQALTPSSFTEVSATTGQLVPKAYTGTFTGNSFWLKFSDNSSTTSGSNVGIGKDFSGLGNYWNSTNLSVTAGAGNDSLVDTPTSYGTDTGAGGEVRGNYATLNPLLPTLTPTNGNLDTPNSAGQNYSTIAVSTGKWYVETTVGPITAGTACGLGLHFNPNADSGAGFYNSGAYIALLYENNLSRYEGTNSNVNFYPTAGAGSILAFRLDLDSGTQTISYYVNNVLITSSNLPAGKTWFVTTRQNNSQSLNFGQRPFAYTAPSGFKALCDTNLPAPVVAKPNTVMDVATYSGSSSPLSITLPGGFSPDLVWIKCRSNTNYQWLTDVIRGTNKQLSSNDTIAEESRTDRISSFDTSGFTVANHDVNSSGNAFVAWCWDAGTTTTTINANAYSAGVPSITSSVRANQNAGFSVVSVPGYTYPTKTAGHGLGVEPHFIITKNRGASNPWIIYHKAAGANTYFQFDTGAGYTGVPGVWSGVSSTVFPINSGVNQQTDIIAYCFAPVAGYSSMGSYVGNGSASDGPFVFCNFRPRWVLVKSIGSAENWFLLDSARNTYNAVNSYLMPNSSSAEDPNNSTVNTDFLSNGFKLRASTSALNSNGVTYIYCAFAESPFQYARAR